MERINLSSIKKESVRAVFSVIASQDQVSRADISAATGLSLMTVGKVADALLERGTVIQAKENKSVAGRKAGLVSLNRDKFILVFDLTARNFSMVVMDISLGLRDRLGYEYNKDFYYEENLYIFMKNVKIYILRKLNMDDCIGVGAVLPGAYNEDDDTVDTDRIPELRATHIRAVMEDVLRTKVNLLERDVLTAAASTISELQKEEQNSRSILYVCISETVSGAFLSDGEILRSHSGCCGDIGRWVTGSGALLREAFSEHGLRRETVELLGDAIAAEIMLFDPDFVILENCVGSRFSSFEETLKSRMKASLHAEETVPLRITESSVGHAYRGLAMQIRDRWIQDEIR